MGQKMSEMLLRGQKEKKKKRMQGSESKRRWRRHVDQKCEGERQDTAIRVGLLKYQCD